MMMFYSCFIVLTDLFFINFWITTTPFAFFPPQIQKTLKMPFFDKFIWMEEKIAFERFLFGEGNEIVIDDMEFCINRIVMLTKIRPHQLEKAVELSVKYCKIAGFRQKLLDISQNCPVLIYKLHKRGILVFEEIKPIIQNRSAFLLSYYFRQEIDDFECFIKSKEKPNDLEESFLEIENNLDPLIEYGFMPSSIEYCLKYDVIDDFLKIDNLNQEARWSPFEWSIRPDFLDLLSFSGFFCSIKCFKHLLMKGFDINENVLSMVVSGGSFDLFHLFRRIQPVTLNLVRIASGFFHTPLLAFMIENGADINAKDNDDCTPLHFAAAIGHLCVVDYLIHQKADINAQARVFRSGTPLHLAAQNGHLSVVEYLGNQKADINAKNTSVEFLYLIGLLFIMQLKMVVLVLLNI